MTTTLAYRGTMTKPATLKQLRAHRKLDDKDEEVPIRAAAKS